MINPSADAGSVPTAASAMSNPIHSHRFIPD